MLSRAERQAALVVVMLILGVGMTLVYLLTNDTTRASSDTRVQDTNVARGQEIFAANCATCHGSKGQGGVGLPLNIPANHPTGDAAITQRYTYLSRTLHNGRPGTYMQAWSQENGGPLNSEQINALVTMIMHGDWNQTAQVVDEYYVKQKATLAPPQGIPAIYTGGVGGNPSLATKGPFPSGVQNPAGGAVAAAGGGGAAPAGAAGKFIGDGHTVNVELKDFAITLDTSLVKPGTTTFKIKNAGPSPHNFSVKELNKVSETIDSGKTTELKVDLTAGSFTGICQIAGHEQLGMKVALTAADMEPPAAAAAAAPADMAAAAGGATNMGVAPGSAINAEMSDFVIKQDYGMVKAGQVTINVKNAGPSPHNYQITGNGAMQATMTLDGGKTATLKVDLKPGTYTVICNVPGHEQLGMKTTLVVQ